MLQLPSPHPFSPAAASSAPSSPAIYMPGDPHGVDSIKGAAGEHPRAWLAKLASKMHHGSLQPRADSMPVCGFGCAALAMGAGVSALPDRATQDILREAAVRCFSVSSPCFVR